MTFRSAQCITAAGPVWRVFGVLLLAAVALLLPGRGFAACSSYIGDMTINEVYELGNEAWVEVRLLDTSVPSSVYENWWFRLCAEGRGCRSYSLSSGQVLYPDTYPEWIRVDVDKRYIDLRNNGGMDIVLWDQYGRAIDYLSVNGYTLQWTGCSSYLYPTTIDTVASDPKGIYRDPDGTGDWVELGLPGANGEPTEGYDNDDVAGSVDLVAHYALEGDVTDSSGNGHDGSSQGTVNYQLAKVCYGAQFDGTGYLQVPDSDDFDLPDAFTVMAWIYPDSLSISGHSDLYSLLSKDDNYEFHLRSSGALYWWWGDDSFSTSDGAVAVGEWAHVAFVYSRDDGAMRVLVNGVQVASYAYSAALPTNSDAFLIGADIATGGSGELTDRRFFGAIDEVRIYDGALSDDEITEVMNASNPCALPTPLAEWRFDECSYDGASALAEDAQGNYDLNAQGDVAGEEDGVVARAAQLPGGEDAFLAATDVPLEDDWTVTTWFRMPFTVDSESRYHVLGAMAGGGTDLLWLDNRDNFSWGAWSSSHTAYGSYEFGDLADGWHHLAAVAHDGQTDLYVDGTLVDSVSLQPSGYLHYVGTSYEQAGGSEGFRAALDEYLVFSGELTETQISTLYQLQAEGRNLDGTLREEILCGPGIDHFEIVHDGSALTCAPESVTVLACADADCTTYYDGDVEVTLLADGETVVTQTVTGSGTFSVRHTTPETVTLSVSSDLEPAQTLQCVDGDGGSSCDLTFYETGFLFTLPDLESCQTGADVAIQAVRMDDTTQACVGDDSFAGTSRAVTFSSSYVSDKTGSDPVSVQGNGDSSLADLPAAATLNFDDEAAASFSFHYDDAGSVTLTASFSGSGDEAGLEMSGSDSFVAYPHHLQISATASESGTDFDLDNTNSNGDPHWPAGEVFDLEVAGACSDSSVTPSFAWPTDLTVDGILPLGGTDGTFTPASVNAETYDSGVAQSTASYSEVGIVTLKAVAEDYLSSGIDVTGAGTIGRFTPYDFSLSWYQDPELAPGCSLGGFTYLGQTFGYAAAPVVKVTALNKDGDVTANYTNAGWWKITQATLISDRSYSAAEGTLEFSGGGVSLSYPVDEDGSGTLTFDADSEMTFTRGTPIAPFDADIDIEVAVVDADGISASGSLTYEDIPFTGEAGGTNADEMRWGRIVMYNAYGSELTPLSMPLRAEYYNGSTFVTNEADECTSLSTSQLTLSGTVSSTATLGHIPLSAGDAGLVFSAPGATGYLDAELDLSAMTWLQYDWDGDGSHDNNPSARASFGLFEGNPAMIYLRESFR